MFMAAGLRVVPDYDWGEQWRQMSLESGITKNSEKSTSAAFARRDGVPPPAADPYLSSDPAPEVYLDGIASCSRQQMSKTGEEESTFWIQRISIRRHTSSSSSPP